MKNKKGFTLIELLAVIVILAIIALIAVPIVLNMIENSRKKAAESSAYGFIDAIEYNNGFANTEQVGYTEINGEDLDVTSSTFNNLKLKGKKPSNGTVTIVNGKVTSATGLCFNDYKVNYDGKVASVEGKCDGSSNPEPATPVYSIGNSINYNPVDNTSCTTPDSTPGTKTGCMKWYVIKESSTSDSTVDVILDHNTTARVSYSNTVPYKEYEQASIKSIVDSDATGWTEGLNPRLITANEIAAITGNTEWNSATATNTQDFYFGSNNTTNYSSQTEEQKARQRSYAWLFDYADNCDYHGCDTADNSTLGYWTSSAVSNDIYAAWGVYTTGALSDYHIGDGSSYGVRPVITINKSVLQ